jgi:uncharacterized membrane protein YdbT with pleckstrin-like domain
MKIKFRSTLLYALIKPIVFLLLIGVITFFTKEIAISAAKTLKINILQYIDYTKIIILVLYGYSVLYTYLIKYELTEEQLIITKGIFSIQTNYLELYRIKDIQLKKPFLLRIIRVYNLVLHTSDKTHSIFFIEGINLVELPNNLRNYVEKNRREKRVFEID